MSERHYLDDKTLAQKISEIQSISEGLDLINEHIVVTDENANIIFMNKAAESHTGYMSEESLGKNPADLWGGHMSDEFYKELWSQIKEQKNHWVGDIQNRRKDGTQYWQEVRITPVVDEAGKVKWFIGLELDITSEKSLLKQTQRLNEILIGREIKMIELKEELDKLKASRSSEVQEQS